MSKKKEKPEARIEIEYSPKEVKKYVDDAKRDKDTPKFSINRKQKDIFSKTFTPLWKLEDLFINEQKARRNAPHTIKHYQRTFKKLYEFLAFTSSSDADNIDIIYEKYADEKSPLAYAGKMLPISSLEMNDIQMEFGDYLEDVDEVGEQTVLSYFRDFRAIMYFAMDNGWIEPYKITINDKDAPIKNCYTNAELDKILKKPDIDNFTEYRDWVLVNYLLATGNRVQTIINLKVGDIDLDEGYININRQKSTKTMRIGLVKKMANILSEYITYYRSDDEGFPLVDAYLFCNRFGEQITDNGLKAAIRSYNRRHGVQKTSMHLFRHTFAKNWIIGGGDIISLQKMLGQSSLKMVQRYANLYASDVKEKAEEYSTLTNTRTKSGKTLKRRK